MNYAGLTDIFEIVIVTLIFSDVSTIKITFVFHTFPYGNLSVALLHFRFVTLFSFQGAATLKELLRFRFAKTTAFSAELPFRG